MRIGPEFTAAGSTCTRRALLHAASTFIIALVGSVACSASPRTMPALRERAPNGDLLETPERGTLPSFALDGGPRVTAAYRYAVEHAAVLQYIPCYCGCEAIGHRSNYDCYVSTVRNDGRVTYNAHAST